LHESAGAAPIAPRICATLTPARRVALGRSGREPADQGHCLNSHSIMPAPRDGRFTPLSDGPALVAGLGDLGFQAQKRSKPRRQPEGLSQASRISDGNSIRPRYKNV